MTHTRLLPTVLALITTAALTAFWRPTAASAQQRRPAPAQPTRPAARPSRPKTPRASVFSVDVGMQPMGHDLTDTTSFSENGEQGSLTATSQGTGGLAVHVAGATSVWRTLQLRVGLTWSVANQPTTFTRTSPHPFFFNRPRTATGDLAAGEAQAEVGLHVGARVPFTLDTKKRWQGAVFGGPSFVHVSRELLTDVPLVEAYPYDTAAAGTAQLATGTASAVSGHAGGELFWVWKPATNRAGRRQTQVGLGGSVLVAPASVTLAGVRGHDTTVKAGGVIAAAGLHLQF